jgi:hypothetical protein
MQHGFILFEKIGIDEVRCASSSLRGRIVIRYSDEPLLGHRERPTRFKTDRLASPSLLLSFLQEVSMQVKERQPWGWSGKEIFQAILSYLRLIFASVGRLNRLE